MTSSAVLTSLQNIAFDSIKTTIATVGVNMTVSRPIHNLVGTNNDILAYSSDGLCYALSNDLVNYVTTGSSELLSGQYALYLDDALYMGTVGYTSDKSGFTELALNSLGYLNLPIGQQYQVDITQGLIVASARELSNVVGASSLASNPVYNWIRHPVSSIIAVA
jgi:hypothetical protein